MRSKERELNFTDYKRLNCYRYIEENDTIEEPFYQTNDSKLCKFLAICYFFKYLFMYHIILFYKYIFVFNSKDFTSFQERFD